MSTGNDRAPSHLKGRARALWLRLRRDFVIDDGAGLALLEIGCTAYQRAESARLQIEREGSTVKDRYGGVRAHPAIGIERDAMGVALRALRGLHLAPDVPEDDR
jgi:phage terminase small subunit